MKKSDSDNPQKDSECQYHVVRNVLTNADNRHAFIGLEMLDFFRSQAKLLVNKNEVQNIPYDIVEFDFGIYKAKKSPNKLYSGTYAAVISKNN